MKKLPFYSLGLLLTLTLSACQDTSTPPTLKLDSNLPYTLSRSFSVQGTGSGLKRVEVALGTQTFKAESVGATFSVPVTLGRGLNTLNITGYNTSGKSVSQKLSVTLGSQVLGGSAHSAALNNGKLYGWGRNNQGQLTGEDKANILSPKLLGMPETLVSLSGGLNSTLMLGQSGKVYQTGLTYSGSQGEASKFLTVPTEVAGLSDVALIASGQYHRLAVTTAGDLYAWGHNSAGQLGLPLTTKYSETPQKVALNGKVVSAAGGGTFSIVALDNGQVYAWGDGGDGQLGQELKQSSVPVQVPGLSDVVMVAAGKSHALALTRSGDVYTWGDNFTGQLGRKVVAESETDSHPTRLEGLKAAQIYASGNFSLSLASAGKAQGWGQNFSGNLGLGGSDEDVTVPTAIGQFVQLAPGLMHTVALSAAGQVQTAGLNSFGQVGNGKVGLENNARTFTPVALP